jgi:hypothetical protein
LALLGQHRFFEIVQHHHVQQHLVGVIVVEDGDGNGVVGFCFLVSLNVELKIIKTIENFG